MGGVGIPVQTIKPNWVLMEATEKWEGASPNWTGAEERPGPGAPRTVRPQFPGADCRGGKAGCGGGANGPGLGEAASWTGSKSSGPSCSGRD